MYHRITECLRDPGGHLNKQLGAGIADITPNQGNLDTQRQVQPCQFTDHVTGALV